MILNKERLTKYRNTGSCQYNYLILKFLDPWVGVVVWVEINRKVGV